MSSYFFEYLESIQVVKQTHQISALNSVSFRDFFKDKHQPPLLSLQLAKGVVYRMALADMTSMTLRILFPHSGFARFLSSFLYIFHCKNSVKLLKHKINNASVTLCCTRLQ